ncbi:MAG: hypothetical protein QOD60_2029 [Solirubrobacterales bacterium]|nr:hypothetical protein [Solirubrobacterales bacterium]
MHLALALGGLLLVIWVTALGFGAFGGFGSLPRPGFAQAEHHAGGAPATDKPPLARKTGSGRLTPAAGTVSVVRAPFANGKGKTQQTAASSASPAPAAATTVTAGHGKSSKTTTGKPLDTPGGQVTGITHGLGHQK